MVVNPDADSNKALAVSRPPIMINGSAPTEQMPSHVMVTIMKPSRIRAGLEPGTSNTKAGSPRTRATTSRTEYVIAAPSDIARETARGGIMETPKTTKTRLSVFANRLNIGT